MRKLLAFVLLAAAPCAQTTLSATLEGTGIEIRRAGGGAPVLTHTVRPDFRPYIHPLAAPHGSGVVTEIIE